MLESEMCETLTLLGGSVLIVIERKREGQRHYACFIKNIQI